MSEGLFKAYFHAVGTEQGRHLLSVGWTAHAGIQPKFERDGANDDYKFTVKESTLPSPQVVTPFCLCVEITGNPRSVTVSVNDKPYLVQVYGIKGVSSGENTAGTWIEA